MKQRARGEEHGERILRSNTGSQRRGETRHAHGALRQIWQRTARTGSRSVARRDWQARLRKRIEGRLEALAGALQDGHERVPAESSRSQLAENYGRADGAVFLRRRRQIARRIRRAQGKELIPLVRHSARRILLA